MNRDLAARLVVGLEGTWPSDLESAWLAHWQPAGVILFSHNIKDHNTLSDLCEHLHQLDPGLEIMADHEGGPISQLAAAVGRPPSAWSLGKLDDVGLTASVFEQTGNRLQDVGVDRVLAPVADVLTEIRNPVIGVRSFGADRSLVTRHVVAAVTGLLKANVKVCLKHWPGHGGSSDDSHLAETAVGQGALPAPFEAGLAAGAGAVMVGHLIREGGEGVTAALPATLDREFMTGSRRRLAPGHVENLLLMADDITMGALGPAMMRLGVEVPARQENGLFDPGTLPVAWFERLASAGCDRLLIRGLPTTAFPVAGEPVKSTVATATGSPVQPVSPAGPYEIARRRLWAQVGGEFADHKADLLWRDFSRHDRWAVAAGQKSTTGGDDLETLQTVLGEMFGSVSTTGEPIQLQRTWNRLLVSSHRPLPAEEDISVGLASRGVCLAMGHPSLAGDLEARLGRRWKILALYDIAPEDLCGGALAGC